MQKSIVRWELGCIGNLIITNDNKYIAISCNNNTLRVLKSPESILFMNLEEHRQRIKSIAKSNDMFF